MGTTMSYATIIDQATCAGIEIRIDDDVMIRAKVSRQAILGRVITGVLCSAILADLTFILIATVKLNALQ
jgi:hypothetical protein